MNDPLKPGRPTVTALIPAHNESATIGRTIDAILSSTYGVEEIIVVADSCVDDTADIARSHGATVVETTYSDKAANQNHVLPSIATDLIVGFDADTLPEPTCIERMVSHLVERRLDAVCATILPLQERGFFVRARRYAYALGRRWWRVAQNAVGRVQVLTGAAYLFKTSAIRAIGGFPTVGISADMDATWTLHGAGYRLGYAGDALALTVDPETFDEYRKQMSRWSAGYFQTMAKHRRQMWRPSALLVVWTALFDLLCMPLAMVAMGVHIATDPGAVRLYGIYFVIHTIVATVLVATVVGAKEAVAGIVPYMAVNLYNKVLYLRAFFREWVLDSHYTGWTGRHGRSAGITETSRARIALLVSCALLASATYCLTYGPRLPSFPLTIGLLLATPWLAMFSVPHRERYDM